MHHDEVFLRKVGENNFKQLAKGRDLFGGGGGGGGHHNIAIKLDLKRNVPVKLLNMSKIPSKFTDSSSIWVSYHQKANCARLCSLDKPSNQV